MGHKDGRHVARRTRLDAGNDDACGAARQAEQGKEKGEADGWARRGFFFRAVTTPPP